MSIAYELAKANVPGFQIRQALIQTGIDAERIRIIKLLESIDYLSDCCIQPNCCMTTSELIALIKGENK